jgi:hypothetical protein
MAAAKAPDPQYTVAGMSIEDTRQSVTGGDIGHDDTDQARP